MDQFPNEIKKLSTALGVLNDYRDEKAKEEESKKTKR